MVKKVIALLGMVMFCSSAFALNTEAMLGESCADQKVAFEKYAADQRNDFVAQHILINMADPMENMTDEQALPLAACYATFKVKGLAFVDFVRTITDIFPGDISGKEAAKLSDFADRVVRLSKKAAFDNMVAQSSSAGDIMKYVWKEMVWPLDHMNEQEAATHLAIYKTFKVEGRPLSEFIRERSMFYDMNAEIKLEKFADTIDPTK